MSKEMDYAQLIAQEEEINLLRNQVEQLEAENRRLREALEELGMTKDVSEMTREELDKGVLK